MASTVASILTGPIFDGISKVINSIRGKSPEDAAKLQEIATTYQIEILQAQTEIEKARIQENISLNETAGANIRAEAGSGKYSANARPSVIYAGLIVILVNYGVLALVPRHYGFTPIVIPDLVWEIWCVCVTGYVFARSGDKLFGGQGGSAQLPFGTKLESKGDK